MDGVGEGSTWNPNPRGRMYHEPFKDPQTGARKGFQSYVDAENQLSQAVQGLPVPSSKKMDLMNLVKQAIGMKK